MVSAWDWCWAGAATAAARSRTAVQRNDLITGEPPRALSLLYIGRAGGGGVAANSAPRGLLELPEQVDEPLDLLVDPLGLGDHEHAVGQRDRGVGILVPALVARVLLDHVGDELFRDGGAGLLERERGAGERPAAALLRGDELDLR